MLRFFQPLAMNFIARLTSGSSTAEKEVLNRLPQSIKVEFLTEFDDDNNPIIFIKAPDYPGLVSQSLPDFKEAVDAALDAILTYFDVPRQCAKVIEYDICEAPEQTLEIEMDRHRTFKEFKLKRYDVAHA